MMKNNGNTIWVVILSLVLLALPFSRIIQASTVQAVPGSMPCHSVQADKENSEEVCPESGLTNCDCCEHIVPMGYAVEKKITPIRLGLFFYGQELSLQAILTQPQNPPYRPPRTSS